MNFQISNFKFQIDRKGYTLIEFLIVVTIIGIVSVVSWVGLGSNRQAESVKSAANQFAVNLRGIQNEVVNGTDGVPVKRIILSSNTSNYASDSTDQLDVTLPAGVTYSVSNSSGTVLDGVQLCFAHPSLAAFDSFSGGPTSPTTCGQCAGGSYFACSESTSISNGTLTINFTSGTATKSVVIEGSQMKIGRIYEQ